MGQLSNDSIAEFSTENLGKFTSQLDHFSQTEAPEAPKAFKETKTSLTSSFSSKIKSYEFLGTFEQAIVIRMKFLTDYLAQSLEDEAKSFKSFKEAQDNEKENEVPISYHSVDLNLNVTSISGFSLIVVIRLLVRFKIRVNIICNH